MTYLFNTPLGNSIFGGLIVAALLAILRIAGVDIFRKFVYSKNFLLSVFGLMFSGKSVYIYTDSDDSLSQHSKVMARKLSEKTLGRFKGISRPEDILYLPMSPIIVKSIIIIITDVTFLSTSRKDREKIQKIIVKFAKRGGVVILGHDVIYRRTRSPKLKALAGCIDSSFKHVEDPRIKYTRYDLVSRPEDHRKSGLPYLDMMPSTFLAKDNEIVVGTWELNVKFLYANEVDSENIIPLIVRKEHERGVTFWINSGDKSEEGEPGSVSEPSNELLEVLSNIIKYEPIHGSEK